MCCKGISKACCKVLVKFRWRKLLIDPCISGNHCMQKLMKMRLLAQGGAFDDGMTGAIDIGDKEVHM